VTITHQATATRPRTEDELRRREPPLHSVRTDPLIDQLLTSTVVTAVDATARTVAFDNGQSIGFSQFLLATGATPRPCPSQAPI
jgi:NADPH-dependent 2,4-dienoyl-CoA reductase/sulfur reductase-like enzyme